MQKIFLLMIAVSVAVSALGCESSYATKNRIRKEQDKIVVEKLKYDYDEMEKDLKALKEKYEDAVSYTSIGNSLEGRALYAVTIGKGEQKLLVVGSVHAREWMTSYLLMNLLELYLDTGQAGKRVGAYNIKKMLQDTTITFVPMLNPDGVDLVLNGVGDRDLVPLLHMNENLKDFSRWKANIAGVDLNRQFNADWVATDSKEAPSFENYKGENYLDQPESQALAALTQKEDFDITAAYHLSGSVIFWYYHQEGANYRRDLRIARRLRWITGYKLVKEQDSDEVAAGFKDWFVKAYKRPGYTIEIGDKRYDEISVKDINQFVRENRKVIPYLAKEAKKIK
ncbi:M14 family zinc carboxypeptidase [Geosporobacter ferrireducens]|uniref:Peptidase M14 domain-containing protein n=1 Tax=Geosporobacter ferrireducens TaxID=1424294 RepID=A0A1D8GHA3_9FIRM|nr:M14 family zinc carboxypeptidase [Geosporobacter ferrireducens]AOT70270.1 hypothetical protein Gferi_12090 [Geosporobacter ferrireducens]